MGTRLLKHLSPPRAQAGGTPANIWIQWLICTGARKDLGLGLFGPLVLAVDEVKGKEFQRGSLWRLQPAHRLLRAWALELFYSPQRGPWCPAKG